MQSLGGSTKRLGLPKSLDSLPEFIGEGGFGDDVAPQPPVQTAPAAFTAGQWSIADAATGGTATVTISALPSNGGSAITAIQYQVGAGAWTASGLSSTGTFNITGLTNGASVNVKVRVVNAIGNGADSDVKSVTPSAGVAPVISITSGSGYAGSVYTSTRSGQWTADGLAIPGSTGDTYTMTMADEGKAIRCDGSNAIEMWTPLDLPTSYKDNGGWWDPKQAVTAVGGLVTALPDQFSLRNMTQSTGSLQPTDASVDGYRAFEWPNTAAEGYLQPSSTFAPAFWLFCMRYKAGSEALFGEFSSWLSTGSGAPNRVQASRNSANLLTNNVMASQASINGGAYSASILPLSKSILTFVTSPVVGSWCLSRNADAGARPFYGPQFEVMALGENPTGDLLARIQGCAAHRNGIANKLPNGHAYKENAPRVQ